MTPEQIAEQLARYFQSAWDARSNTDEGPMLIGIAGIPGSGKTTVASAVRDVLNKCGPDTCVVVPMDGFHLYRSELDRMDDPQAAHARRGAPWTFDAQKFRDALITIKKGKGVSLPGFDHSVGDPEPGQIHTTTRTQYVIVEGNYLLLDEQVWCDVPPLLYRTYFMEVDFGDAMRRLALRHMQAWGMTQPQADHRIATNDVINARLVQASRPRADEILYVEFNTPS